MGNADIRHYLNLLIGGGVVSRGMVSISIQTRILCA